MQMATKRQPSNPLCDWHKAHPHITRFALSVAAEIDVTLLWKYTLGTVPRDGNRRALEVATGKLTPGHALLASAWEAFAVAADAERKVQRQAQRQARRQ